MKFIQLTHDSSVEDAKTYLVQLAQSPFHYHLDDDLDGMHWGGETPDPETLQVMKNNIGVVWDMHLYDRLSWDDTWDVYHDAWKDHERKQSIENNA